MKYLEDSRKYLEEHKADDLYFTIKDILDKKLMTFNEVILRFSQGVGIVSGEGSGILLDDDWDEPNDFGKVEFYAGGYLCSVIDIKTYILSIEHICQNYLAHYPENANKIQSYLLKLNNRYFDLLN